MTPSRPPRLVVATKKSAETRALGAKLGAALRPGDLLCLIGPLGSGKTTFVQGLARGAGLKSRVTSPTFVLAKVYKGKRLTLHHLDLYRVASGETAEIGIEECLSDPQGACAVEWPESGLKYYPGDRVEILFAHGRGAEERTITVKAAGPRSRELVGRLGTGGAR